MKDLSECCDGEWARTLCAVVGVKKEIPNYRYALQRLRGRGRATTARPSNSFFLLVVNSSIVD